jgi:hypothetical protein
VAEGGRIQSRIHRLQAIALRLVGLRSARLADQQGVEPDGRILRVVEDEEMERLVSHHHFCFSHRRRRRTKVPPVKFEHAVSPLNSGMSMINKGIEQMNEIEKLNQKLKKE